MSVGRSAGLWARLGKKPFLAILPILVVFLFALPVWPQNQSASRVSLPGLPEPIYSPDPNDAWNRIFYFLFSRRMEVRLSDEFPEGAPFDRDGVHMNLARMVRAVSKGTFERTEIGDRAIDPLYPVSLDRSEARMVLSDPVYAGFKKALQDALHENKNVPRSPVARALMQSDLWSAHDLLFDPLPPVDEKGLGERRRGVLDLLAQLIRKVALTAQEMKALPDNYAAAVRAYSLPELFHKDSGWIEMNWFPARQHDREAGYRRVSRIFLKPTHPPRDVQAFLDARPGRGAEELDAVALVMQLLLIDANGNVRPTALTTDVQARQFERTSEGVFKKTTIQVYEVSRKLFVHDPHSAGLVEEQENSPAYFGNYDFAANFFPNAPGQFHVGPPVQIRLRTRCALCHGDGDLKQIITFAIVIPPSPPRVKQLTPENNDEAKYDIALKTKQKNFQALRGYFR